MTIGHELISNVGIAIGPKQAYFPERAYQSPAPERSTTTDDPGQRTLTGFERENDFARQAGLVPAPRHDQPWRRSVRRIAHETLQAHVHADRQRLQGRRPFPALVTGAMEMRRHRQ